MKTRTFKIIKLTACFVLICMSMSFAEPIDLDPVVVTASRNGFYKAELANNVTIITEQDIKDTNAVTIADVLKTVVGITDITTRGTIGSASFVKIRGGNANHTLVMIDSQPINDTSLGSADINTIPLSFVDRIEIVRGPVSAVWGANAVNGVINIITKQGQTDKFNSEITLLGGSFSRHRINFTGQMTDEFNNTLFGQAAYDHCGGFRENSGFYGNSLFIKTGHDLDKLGLIDFRVFLENKSTGISGSNNTNISDYDGALEREAGTPKANQKDTKWYIQADHEKELNKDYLLKSRFNTAFTNRLYKDPDALTETSSNAIFYLSETELICPNQIVIGMDNRYDIFKRKNEITNNLDIKKYAFSSALFAEKVFSIDKLTTILGLRYDYHSVFGSQVNPRTSFIYLLNQDTKISFNAGRSYRAPTFEDLYSPYTSWPASIFGNAGDTQGNENIDPEIIWGYDFGVQKSFGKLFTTRFTFFRNDIKDLIYWSDTDKDTLFDQYRPVNVGESFQQGAEFEIEQNILKHISHNINMTFIENEGKKDTDAEFKTLAYTRPIKLNYWLNFKTNIGFNLNVVINYNDKTKWEDDWGTDHELDEYTTGDIHLKQIMENIEIFVSVYNIEDVKYQNIENYPLPGRE
ncbi:TonB-dependent receptor plug domain-containing protein, partial [bacterium]